MTLFTRSYENCVARCCAIATLLLALACGKAEDGALAGNAGQAGSSAAGAAGLTTSDGGSAPTIEPGSVGMRLLTGSQYRNTLRDLLGVMTSEPPRADAAPSDAGRITDLKPYLDSATDVAGRIFSAPELPPLLRCPGSSSERECARSVIDVFGERAFRRPLLAAERTPYVALYDSVVAGGEPHAVALEQVLRSLLVSLQFLFRVELVPEGARNEPYALDSYAMAARLSYLLWDTTPDPLLVDAARQDELATDAGLRAQLQRFLADAADTHAFSERLGSTWLGVDIGIDRLAPSEGQKQEVASYLASFFEGRPIAELLTTELPSSTDGRLGLLGLSGVLAATTHGDRVVISERGAWVQGRLLCRPPPAPHPEAFPELAERPALEAAVTSTACLACHEQLDPIGIALDHFDYEGKYRAAYASGRPIDTRVTLATGELVVDQASLARALAEQARFPTCLAEQLSTQPLGRAITEKDGPYLSDLSDLVRKNAGLAEIYERIVLSVPFRSRRPSPE